MRFSVEKRLVVGSHGNVLRTMGTDRFVMYLSNVLFFFMLREMVCGVMLVLMVGFVGQVGIGGLKTHLSLVVDILMSWSVRIVVRVRVSVTIRINTSLMFVTTCIVGALAIWIARCVAITIGCMLTAIAAMRVLFVTMMLLLEDIVVLVGFLGFVALHSSVLIGWLALDWFKRSWLMFKTWVPLDGLIWLHLEDKMTTVNVRLRGFESRRVGVECGIVTLVPSVGIKGDKLISPVEVESLGLRIVSIGLNVVKHQVPGHVFGGEILTP